MSDETIPKLRLRPKLAADPASTTPASAEIPSAASVPAEVPPAPGVPAPIEEPKAFRLKPKISLSASPVEAAKPASAAPIEVKAPSPVEIPPSAPAPPAEPTVGVAPSIASVAGAPKFSFKPKAELAAAPAPVAKVEAPAPVGPEAPAPAAAEVPPVAPVANFPPPVPVGKFPPPPGVKKPIAGATEKSTSAAKPVDRKKLLLVGGGVLGVAMLGAGYFLFLYSPDGAAPLPPPKKSVPAVVANPSTGQGQAVAAAQTAVEKANEQMAPLNEVLKSDQPMAAVTSAPEAAKAVVVAPPPIAAIDLGPPPPSVAFREWVSTLRIGSVRTGAKPRILIEKTSYDVGDTVNQQLGISFEGYNAATRMLIFKDRSGAIVERRN